MKLSTQQLTALNFIASTGFALPEINLSTVDVEKITAGDKAYLKVTRDNDKITVCYSHESLLFRALCVILPKLIRDHQEEAVETTSLTEVGYSLDASRNAVMKVAVLKKFIAYLALNGFNTLYLYIEDTYKVSKLPYMGYLRGAYTTEEIKEIVRFAKIFEMEVVPCIQTLAHLTQFLKWPSNFDIMDDGNTLLIGEEKTYEVIEKMLAGISATFTSRKIHLGMDEAYQAGLGRFLNLHGYRNRTELMIEHLNRVVAIAKKYQLEPTIWSDFIYKLLNENKSERLYPLDAKINLKHAQQLPAGLHYVHWDYGNEDVEKYERVISNHLEFCDLDHYVFAGGAHIWNKIAPNHGKSINTIKASIAACRKQGVKSAMLTTWGDDGQETDHWHSLISAICYTEQIYGELEMENVAVIFDQMFGKNSFALMYELRKFDEVDSIPLDNPNMTNISKLILWQDPLFGIYDVQIAEHNEKSHRPLGEYYGQLSAQLADIPLTNKTPQINLFQLRFVLLGQLLAKKAELGLAIRSARLADDQVMLKKICAHDLPELIRLVDQLKRNHRAIWCSSYKENGWEVLELRYAGLSSRLETTQAKLENYLAGTDSLDELLEERLSFGEFENPIDFNGFNYRQTAVTGYN